MTTGGFSSTRLARVRDVVARHIEAGDGPGAVAVVARRGEVHVETMGTLAFEGAGSSTPMAMDTIFRVASLSKPLVSACVMTLIEEGLLRLDDPIDEVVPELADMRVLVDPNGPLEDTVPAQRAIRVRDLLTYTLGTGMAVGVDIDTSDDGRGPIVDLVDGLEPPVSPDDYMRRLGDLPLFFQPGERWMYELAADVMVVLVSRVAGKPFGDVLQERICEPLGMTDTGFSVGPDAIDRLSTAYRRVDGQLTVDDGPDGLWSKPPGFESGGGGIVSTPQDYLAFASTMLSGGRCSGGRVLSRPSVALMTTDHLTPAQKAVSGFWPGYFDDFGWGFGMSVRTRPTHLGPSVGSYGWMGYGCSWFNDPAEDLTTLFMVQQFSAPTWRLDFVNAAYQAIDD